MLSPGGGARQSGVVDGGRRQVFFDAAVGVGDGGCAVVEAQPAVEGVGFRVPAGARECEDVDAELEQVGGFVG